jgi:hypothetical protein
MTFLSQITSGTQNTINLMNPMNSGAIPRASYAILSSNTSSTWHGAVFLDGEFRRIGSTSPQSFPTQYGAGSVRDMEYWNDTYVGATTQMYYNLSVQTQTSMSTTAYVLPVPGTASMGEYGQACVLASERGVISPYYMRSFSTTNTSMIQANRAFVNSDHQNKKLTLQFSSAYLTTSPLQTPIPRAVASTAPFFRPQKDLTSIFSTFDAGSQTTSMFGSASYNNVRKELMVATFTSTTSGRVNVAIWKNFNFDAVNGDVSTLGAPDVLLNTTLASWTNTNEGRFNSKWVLVDDGSIFVSSFNEGSNTTNFWKITRAGEDASLSNVLIDTQSMTTSYGVDQGIAYGQRQMQTRDGSMVVSWMPYYYYQCGIRSWVVDKRNSSWARGYSQNNSTSGTHPMKYRNDGFAYYIAGNYYSSNPTGASIGAFTSRGLTAGSDPVTYTGTLYQPVAPGPNTTNYPGMTHVMEFDFQTNLPY